MRHFHRVVMLSVMLGLASALAGCENFDPDKLDFLNILNSKKPVPGERKAVFPEGVPGVTQGIPPEYLQRNVQQQTGAASDGAQTSSNQPQGSPDQADAAPAPSAPATTQTAAVEPAADAKPKTAVKPKPKRQIVKRKPTTPQATSQSQNQDQNQDQNSQKQESNPWPAQAQAQPASQSARQAEPSQQAQSPWPAPAQNSAAPWPSAPPPGTFSK